jgi:MerR family regulatory protein
MLIEASSTFQEKSRLDVAERKRSSKSEENAMNGLTIGGLAELAKVHVETLRYYERRGLIERPPRSASNYRLYPEDAVQLVRFIKRAQELGLRTSRSSSPFEPPLQPSAERFAGMRKPKSKTSTRRSTPSRR